MRITIKYIPFIFMYLISVGMVALVDLAYYNFSIERIKDESFWSPLITVAIANLIVFSATLMIDVMHKKETDKRILKTHEEIDDFIVNKMDVDYSEFNDEDNRERKIRKWKIKVKRKLRKLENKKSSKRRDRKIKLYEKMLSDEYIKRYIDSIKIRYYRIKMSKIMCGHNTRSDEEHYQSGLNAIVQDVAPRFILSMSFPVFLASFLIEPKHLTLGAAMLIASKILSLIMNVINAKMYAPVYVEKVVLYNLRFSLKRIEKYLAWKVNRKKAGDHIETN